MKFDIKPLSVNKAWRGGRRFNTTEYKDYIEEMGYLLAKFPKYKGWVEINYQFYLKNYNATDVGNLEKPLSDILVKWNILDDDKFIKKITMEKFRSKEDYVIIEIKKIEN